MNIEGRKTLSDWHTSTTHTSRRHWNRIGRLLDHLALRAEPSRSPCALSCFCSPTARRARLLWRLWLADSTQPIPWIAPASKRTPTWSPTSSCGRWTTTGPDGWHENGERIHPGRASPLAGRRWRAACQPPRDLPTTMGSAMRAGRCRRRGSVDLRVAPPAACTAMPWATVLT